MVRRCVKGYSHEGEKHELAEELDPELCIRGVHLWNECRIDERYGKDDAHEVHEILSAPETNRLSLLRHLKCGRILFFREIELVAEIVYQQQKASREKPFRKHLQEPRE